MEDGSSSYRRYLDGDDKGIAEIVETYKDGLILFLNGYVNNIYIAEELAEDTFFRLLTKKPRFSGKCNFKTWLYAVGRNVTVDYLRHHAKIADTPIEDMASYLRDEQDLEESCIREDSKIRLHKALSALPPDYRHVLYLVYFADFSNPEAAVALHKNERQIRNLLYRAKQALKSELEKEGFPYENQ